MNMKTKKMILLLIICLFYTSCKSEIENKNKNVNNEKVQNSDSNNNTNTSGLIESSKEDDLAVLDLKKKIKKSESKKQFEKLRDTIIKFGIKEEFFNKILDYEKTEFNEKYINLNVTNLFTNSGKSDYSKNYNDIAIKKSKEFLKDNYSVLSLVESKYDVPMEYIVSILYIETRHGNYTGNNHVLSVFLTTAMSNNSEIIEENIIKLTEYYQNNKDKIERNKDLNFYLDKYITRANKKAKWALGELKILETINNKNTINIFELEGSYAGAFGWSQFLPSSYNSWGIDGNNDGKIDLFNKEDAIFSVGNYLKKNGWENNEEGRYKAIFHYNNSKDYVHSVITLAEKIKS